MTAWALVITERQWQAQVTDLAKMYRWAVYHTQLSKWSEAGWPDLALVRPPRLILAELKSERGRLSEGQGQWLRMLTDVAETCHEYHHGGLEVYLWRPADLEAVAEVLR